MRCLIQRVRSASVSIDGETVGQIGAGLLVLLGIHKDDTMIDCETLLDKTLTLRIFEDHNHKMNRSLLDVGGEMLVVSQFTLLADTSCGRRPSFTQAKKPDEARVMVGAFANLARSKGVTVAEGRFGADMDVSLVNCGPVTIWLDSAKTA